LSRTKFNGSARAKELEAWIDINDAQLPPLRTFIVPGGGHPGIQAAVASTLHRRKHKSCFGSGILAACCEIGLSTG
jgi:cob(I)alamin adenosyltransferase